MKQYQTVTGIWKGQFTVQSLKKFEVTGVLSILPGWEKKTFLVETQESFALTVEGSSLVNTHCKLQHTWCFTSNGTTNSILCKKSIKCCIFVYRETSTYRFCSFILLFSLKLFVQMEIYNTCPWTSFAWMKPYFFYMLLSIHKTVGFGHKKFDKTHHMLCNWHMTCYTSVLWTFVVRKI